MCFHFSPTTNIFPGIWVQLEADGGAVGGKGGGGGGGGGRGGTGGERARLRLPGPAADVPGATACPVPV